MHTNNMSTGITVSNFSYSYSLVGQQAKKCCTTKGLKVCNAGFPTRKISRNAIQILCFSLLPWAQMWIRIQFIF
jgi:hypothetical protein